MLDKNLDWLKNKVDSLETEVSEYMPHNDMIDRDEVLDLIDQLDEPEITDPTISKKENVEIPQFVADYLEKLKGWDDDAYCYEEDNSMSLLSALDLDTFGLDEKVKNYLIENSETFARAWLDDYTIEPQKTLQVIVKNYDSTVFTTELPEDEAMKLIEGWKGNE